MFMMFIAVQFCFFFCVMINLKLYSAEEGTGDKREVDRGIRGEQRISLHYDSTVN